MTAIRTIEYTASPSGVKPIAPQDAGVRGEHKATNVVFNLDASLIKPEYKYRFEYVDGFSGFDTTEFVQPVGSTVSILLPVEWTAGGGCGTLRLCIVALDSQSNEEQTIYTFPASLLFAERETGGECNYKKGLSALIDSAGKATDAANEAAESANAAADRVDESVSSANAATANANRAAASADASAATANAAAGGAQEAKEAADTAASGANTAAEQARTAAASANTAAGTASTAASNANAVADAVQAKLDAGELKGEKGDTGPQGPQGVSGVYVGDGDMPEGYTVQVDPTGDMLCYTAGESDSRYLRATEIRRPFTGGGITLTDADDAAFGGVTVLGATTEAGTGDKGPDNPYALTGVQPASLTVCGKNLLPSIATSGTTNGLTRAVDENGVIHLSGTASSKVVVAVLSRRETPYFWLREKAYRPAEGTKSMVILVVREDGTTAWTNSKDISAHVPCGILSASYEFAAGAPDVNTLYPYLGLEPNQPYEPYTGQTVSLPAIAPLWGTGDIRDEYDAATGVENRRWKRLVFDGTEAWATRTSGAGVYGYTLLDVFDAPAAAGVCTHFKFIKNGASGMQTAVCVASASTQKALSVFTTIATLDGWKAYLNAQATAGTPVTVVYQLDAPVVTQHGPQRIPTYPGCTNLMLDISAEGAVRYPLSAPMQWDAKADKTVSDDRYANVLTGAASGPVAALEDVSPTGALRRAAVLGATAETGTGEKGPDNPYTIAGAAPTALTVCGRNLAANPRFDAVDQFSPCVYADCELQPNTKYTISLYVPAGEAYYTNENLFVKVVYLPVSNGGIYSAVVTTKPTISNTDPKQYAAGKGWILLKVQSGTTASGNARDLQIEFGDTATPYEPYTGQTIDLPALEPLYGDGTVNDEYDAATGVENRRWKRVVFDGTESMRCEAHGNGQRYVSIDLDAAANKSVMPISTHYTSSAWTQDNNKVYIPNPVVMVITDSRFTTLQAARDILAAQYAAGTPVTVVYQLAEPVITQHDPARILPPAPVCRVFADAGGVDVGYNRDINIAFEQQQAEYIAQIKALDARIAKLETGQPAEPMT